MEPTVTSVIEWAKKFGSIRNINVLPYQKVALASINNNIQAFGLILQKTSLSAQEFSDALHIVTWAGRKEKKFSTKKGKNKNKLVQRTDPKGNWRGMGGRWG